MGLFGNKFNKIKRSDVVDTIISLEKQQQEILEQIENRNKSCDEFMKKGKLEKDTNMRMYYAKKISTMKKENLLDTKRLQFIDSNILSMQQLKNALDDKEFIKNNSKMSLNQMLSKPAELRSFIAKINNDKMKREEQVAENLTTFEEINEEYIENFNFSDIVNKERSLHSTSDYGEKYLLSVYKTSNGDILIYPNVVCGSVVYSNDFNNIEDVIIEKNIFFGDYILQTYGEEEKFIFKKCVYHIKNDSLFFSYNNLLSYKRLYLDFECDFLMNYIKFLCEKNDESVTEFLNINPKYKLVYDIAINGYNDTLSNEMYTDDIINNEFEYKTIFQNMKNKHKENYNKINKATTMEELQTIV